MIESEFIALADRLLEAIGEALDASDADLDWRIDDGILEIDCAGSAGAGGKIIVNRHVPNRELWLATKNGGFHYRLDDGAFVNTRGGDRFAPELARALRAQAGVDVPLPPLDGTH
jgi:CyaY protein